MPKTQSLADIQKQIADLQRRAESLKEQDKAGVIGRIKEAIAVYGLTAAELGFGGTVAAKAAKGTARKRGPGKAKAAANGAKYGDGTGNVWGGRGPRPQWLRAALAAGKSLQDFELAGHRVGNG